MGKKTRPGLYLHIPFCQSKCGYCDFYSVTDLSMRSDFLRALKNEIMLHSELAGSDTLFDTIYLGGGTPSLLEPTQVENILRQLNDCFDIDPGAEITIEVNPGTANQEKLDAFSLAGVNRLSIGVQSFNDHLLRQLQRLHTAEQAREAIIAGRKAGFKNISLDFIYGVPGQSRLEWQNTLRTAIGFEPEHISAYSLIIEPDTPFYWLKQNGHLQVSNEDLIADYFSDTREILCQNTYLHYEISNYARSDLLISRHNAKYWDHTPYIGFGPAAHSFWQNRRWGNHRSLEAYIKSLLSHKPASAFNEKLELSDLVAEHILLALRTSKGINISEFNKKYNINFLNKFGSAVRRMINSKHAILSEDSFVLTEKGMLICDELTLQFAL